MGNSGISGPSHYQSDSPTRVKGDMLDRGLLAKNLANLVRSYSKDEPLFIGVTGKWGSGKTSFLLMLEEELSQHPYLAVRWLKPWLLGNIVDVLESAVATIAEALRGEDGIGSEGLSALRKFGAALVRGTSLSVAIPGIGSADVDLKKIALQLEKREGEQLAQLREVASKFIRKAKKRVVILIDDCDRLEVDEVRQLLRLLRTAMDFPGMVFVVGSDERVLRSALSHDDAKAGGIDALGKFLQVVVPLPQATPDQMRKIVLGHVDVLSTYLSRQGVALSGNELEELRSDVDNFLVEMLETPRDAIRWVNSCILPSVHLHGEIDRADVCLLYALRLLAPDAFEYLWQHREKYFAILGVGSLSFIKQDKRDDAKREFAEGFRKVLTQMGSDPAKLLHRLLGRSLQGNSIADLAKYKRFGSPEYYPVAFALGVGVAGVSDRKIDQLKSLAETQRRDDWIALLSNMVTADNWFSVVRSLSRLAEDGNEARVLTICGVLIDAYQVVCQLELSEADSSKSDARNTIFRLIRGHFNLWQTTSEERKWIARVLADTQIDFHSRLIFGFDFGRFFNENDEPVWAPWFRMSECVEAIESVTVDCRAEVARLPAEEWDWSRLALYLLWIAEADGKGETTRVVRNWLSNSHLSVGQLLHGFGSWWSSSGSPDKYRLFRRDHYKVLSQVVDPSVIIQFIGELTNLEELLKEAREAEMDARSQTPKEMMAVFTAAHNAEQDTSDNQS